MMEKLPVLSPEEIAEIESEASHYEQKQAASIEALKIVQKHRGWVSDESLRAIADLLKMSAADLDSIATFYNLIYRKPVGRHVIMVCDSVSCFVMGCDRLKLRLEEKLGIAAGQTTADGRFTLLPIVCLGACDRAPAVQIDNELIGPVEDHRLDELLEPFE